MRLKLRILGLILAIVGIGGYFTVADDLRHKGELIGVSTVLLAGLITLIISFLLKPKVKNPPSTAASLDS